MMILLALCLTAQLEYSIPVAEAPANPDAVVYWVLDHDGKQKEHWYDNTEYLNRTNFKMGDLRLGAITAQLHYYPSRVVVLDNLDDLAMSKAMVGFTKLRPEQEGVLKALGSNKFKEREAASKTIEAHPDYDLLARALLSKDVEVRNRAGIAIDRIQYEKFLRLTMLWSTP